MINEDGIKREHTYIDTEEDVTMPLYILHPSQKSKGTFIALAGHNGAGKESVAGIKDNPAVKDKLAPNNWTDKEGVEHKGFDIIVNKIRDLAEE